VSYSVAMEQRRIGRLAVSVAGLGCDSLGLFIDEERSREVVHAALDEGITFFDTADVYGLRFELPGGKILGTHAGASEEFLGRALGKRRSDVVIATKFGMPMHDDERHAGGSAGWVKEAVEGSLRRLRTDYIDLYQQHWPDPNVALEETLEALEDLVRAGKVREIGSSNYSPAEIDEADEIAATKGSARMVSAQVALNLLERTALKTGMVSTCERRGVRLLPTFPLASGILTGKYRRGERPLEDTRMSLAPPIDDATFDIIEALSAFAAERGHTLLELACSWLAAAPSVVSVIAGATKPEQVRANAAAVDWKLTDEDMRAIDTLLRS
jgi:aryl-alcohol dehydrogenase-like predicted oxidoreductase